MIQFMKISAFNQPYHMLTLWTGHQTTLHLENRVICEIYLSSLELVYNLSAVMATQKHL